MENQNTSKGSNGIKLTLFIDSKESAEESIEILKGVIKFFDYKVEVGCEVSRKSSSSQEEFAKIIKKTVSEEIKGEQRAGGLLFDKRLDSKER